MSPKKNDIFQDFGSKIPPQAVDLEEALLGSVMLIETLDYCYKTISSSEFYMDAHRLIYEAFEELNHLKIPITVEIVSQSLKEKGKLDQVGGIYYLLQLTGKGMAVAPKIDYYAKIIHQEYIARELINLAQTILDEAFDPNSDVADIIDKITAEVNRLQKINILDVPRVLYYERIFIKAMITNATNFIEYKPNVPDDLFLDKMHQKLWNVMKLLSDNNIEIALFSIEDILRESSNEHAIPYIKEIIETEYTEEINFEYLFDYLKRNYERIQLLKIVEYLQENRFDKEPEEIVAKLDLMLDNIRAKDVQSVDFAAHLDSTMMDIITESKEGNLSILTTGFDKFDHMAMLGINDLVIIGGTRGSGKTRLAIKFAYEILTRNIDCASCIICMEETIDKVIRVFISILTGLTDSQLQSKFYMLNPKDKESILEAKKKLKELDIQIICQPVSIKQAKAIFSKFSKKRKTKRCIFILDNIMLLEDNNSKVEADDFISKQLVYIKKATGGLIMALHHVTKESESYLNAQEGYRPKDSHLKGSTRYTDTADHVIMLNNPSKYADLVRSESTKPAILIDGKKVKREKILSRLLISEICKNRDGTNVEEERLIRFFADMGKMTFKEWR